MATKYTYKLAINRISTVMIKSCNIKAVSFTSKRYLYANDST